MTKSLEELENFAKSLKATKKDKEIQSYILNDLIPSIKKNEEVIYLF